MSKHQLPSVAVAISLLVIFLVGFLPNTALFISIKLLLILALGAAVFFYFWNLLPSPEAASSDEAPQAADSVPLDVPSQLLKIKTNQDVEEYFEMFLKTVFPIIKQTMVGNSAVLLMANYPKKKFYIRYKLSDQDDHFSQETHFDFNQGLPALILRNKKSLIENHLPDSENLLPYYDSSKMPARSFLGVPLFFDDYIVGILCVDSNVEESFGPEDLEILTEYSKTIAIQLACSNRLYEYETENWTTRLLYDFSKGILQIQSSEELWQYIDNSLKSVFGADRLIISERVDQGTGKIVYLSGPAHALQVGNEYTLSEGIVGWAFRKNQSLLVEDFDAKANYIPRFLREESPAKEFKSFLAVPVARDDISQMVISLESYKAKHFNEQHKKILETMAYQVASYLEKARIILQLQAQSLIDPKTRLGNFKALMAELNKEICRSTEFGRIFSLQLIKVHAANSSIDEAIYDRLLAEFVSFILPLLNPANYIFRLKNDNLAIVWPEKKPAEAIADFQSVLEMFEQKRPWVDGAIERAGLQCGIVQFPDSGENGTELIENAKKALTKAELKGQTAIEVYQFDENVKT